MPATSKEMFRDYLQSGCRKLMSFQQYRKMIAYCDGDIELAELVAYFPLGAIEEVPAADPLRIAA